jgi:quinoprotein glucose dehydrogenase
LKKLLLSSMVLLLGLFASASAGTVVDWPVAAGDDGATRYSPLSEIDRSNVARLEVAWSYRHGDVRSGWPDPFKGTAFEASPIVVDGRLIFPTPFDRVIALDPETGRELWTFDPQIDKSRRFGNLMVNRGVAYWHSRFEGGTCTRRVFLATLDARLISLDAATGRRCEDFGRSGEVDLLEGIENVTDPWEYNETSPPTVVGDVVILGSSICDEIRRIQASGAVRAYDARSGRLVWRFDPIPRDGQRGAETWPAGAWQTTGAANVWSTITADPARGLVFLPVSSAAPDFIGVDRRGANLFSDSVVALDTATGAYRWHFQTVHHDLWDYDLPAPPILVRVRRDGREIDAVAQVTKTGFVFILDRESGAPLFPVEERPVPKSDIPGEESSPTQPFPLKPPPLVPLELNEHQLWAADSSHLARCQKRLQTIRNRGPFTPPSTEWTILYPSTIGGANWSGGAFDPARGLFFVPTNDEVHLVRLNPLPSDNFQETGGLVLRNSWSALRWLLWRTGTGLRYGQLRDLLREGGKPCNRPPWGVLHAVDLDRGEVRWQTPIGEDEEGNRGLLNFGPPLVTAGGLVFVGGTKERKLRAFDADTGAVLASFDLPAGLHAGPITYKTKPDGDQFLVVAPGGHARLGSTLGDWIVAYRLGRDGR